jgi:hypothetical protein
MAESNHRPVDPATTTATTLVAAQRGGQKGRRPAPNRMMVKPSTYAVKECPTTGSMGAMNAPNTNSQAQNASQLRRRQLLRRTASTSAVLIPDAINRQIRNWRACSLARTWSKTVQAT